MRDPNLADVVVRLAAPPRLAVAGEVVLPDALSCEATHEIGRGVQARVPGHPRCMGSAGTRLYAETTCQWT